MAFERSTGMAQSIVTPAGPGARPLDTLWQMLAEQRKHAQDLEQRKAEQAARDREAQAKLALDRDKLGLDRDDFGLRQQSEQWRQSFSEQARDEAQQAQRLALMEQYSDLMSRADVDPDAAERARQLAELHGFNVDEGEDAAAPSPDQVQQWQSDASARAGS